MKYQDVLQKRDETLSTIIDYLNAIEKIKPEVETINLFENTVNTLYEVLEILKDETKHYSDAIDVIEEFVEIHKLEKTETCGSCMKSMVNSDTYFDIDTTDDLLEGLNLSGLNLDEES